MNHILSGIEIANETKLPHIGADIFFAAVLAILNASIYPVLKIFGRPINVLRIAVIALIMNFALYALLKIISVGIHITSVEGYLCASLAVAIASFWTNYSALRHANHLRNTHFPSEKPPFE